MPRETRYDDDRVQRSAVLRLRAAVHEADGRLARLAVQQVGDAPSVEAREVAHLGLAQRGAIDAAGSRAGQSLRAGHAPDVGRVGERSHGQGDAAVERQLGRAVHAARQPLEPHAVEPQLARSAAVQRRARCACACRRRARGRRRRRPGVRNSGAAPAARMVEPRELASRVAGAGDEPVGEQTRRLVRGLALVRREVLEPARRPDRRGRGRGRTACSCATGGSRCSDQSHTLQTPSSCASSRRPLPSRPTRARSKSTPFRSVCVNAKVEPSGANAPSEWIASGSCVRASSRPLTRVEARQRVPLVAAGIARDHDALVGAAARRARHAVLAEGELVVQPVGSRDVQLQRARVVGQVGELARREVPDERGRAHAQEGLDRRSHRRRQRTPVRGGVARAAREADRRRLRWAR